MNAIIKSEFNAHLIASKDTMRYIEKEVEIAAKLCIESLSNNHKILLFGNGGSAADAQHLAAELVGRYKTQRKGLPAIALTTDSSSITAISNDFCYNLGLVQL